MLGVHVMYVQTWPVLLLLCSPERTRKEILLDLDSTHNIFKDKVPKAKEEMEERLQVRMILASLSLCASPSNQDAWNEATPVICGKGINLQYV